MSGTFNTSGHPVPERTDRGRDGEGARGTHPLSRTSGNKPRNTYRPPHRPRFGGVCLLVDLPTYLDERIGAEAAIGEQCGNWVKCGNGVTHFCDQRTVVFFPCKARAMSGISLQGM